MNFYPSAQIRIMMCLVMVFLLIVASSQAWGEKKEDYRQGRYRSAEIQQKTKIGKLKENNLTSKKGPEEARASEYQYILPGNSIYLPGIEIDCFAMEHYSATTYLVQKPNLRNVYGDFIAKGDRLTSVRIRLDGNGSIRVKIEKRDSPAQTIHEFTTTIQGEWTIMDFVEPLDVVSGCEYRVKIERPTGNLPTFDAYGSKHDYDDLIMVVQGERCFELPQVPTKRVLLVLLENGGIGSSLRVVNLDLAKVGNLRYIVYNSELDGKEIIFKLNEGETLVSALVRIKGNLRDLASEATTSVLAAFEVAASLTNFENWELRSKSAEDAINEYSDFLLENITSSSIQNETQGRYDNLTILEDDDFTEENVLNVIKGLAGQYAIDIHVLSHGNTNNIVGYNNEHLGKGFFKDIMKEKWRLHAEGLPMYFRAVYQMNCNSGTLKREWRSLGTNVVCGTSGEFKTNATLNCLPTQYYDFLKDWYQDGKTFNNALNDSFNTAKDKVDDAPYLLLWVMGLLGMDTSESSEYWQLVLDSELSSSGDGHLKWDSPCATGS